MLSANSETNRKAMEYDVALQEKNSAIEVKNEYIHRYDALFAQKNQALKAKAKEISDLKIKYSAKIERILKEKTNLEATIMSLTQKAENAGYLRDKLNDWIIKYEKEKKEKELTSKRNDNLTNEIKKMRVNKGILESRLSTTEDSLNDVKRILKDKKLKMEKLVQANSLLIKEEKEFMDLKDNHKKLLENYARLKFDMELADKKNDELAWELNKNKQYNDDLEVELRKIKKQLGDKIKIVEDKNQEIAKLIRGNEILKKDKNDLEKRISDAEENNKQAKIRLAKEEAQNVYLNQKLKTLQESNVTINYADQVKKLKVDNQHYREALQDLKTSLAKQDNKNWQQKYEDGKLVEWARQYFWIIEIWLDEAINGKKPFQIRDAHGNIYIPAYPPETIDEIEYVIKKFIADNKGGGRSENRVIIMIKYHSNAGGSLEFKTKRAIKKGNWESFKAINIDLPGHLNKQ